MEDAPDSVVYIHAVGIKKRDQVWIGNEVIDLRRFGKYKTTFANLFAER